MKKNVTLKTFLIITYFILFPCQYFAFGSTVRLVPLTQDNISGSGMEYALIGEDLDGLGSVEVTLRYPPGSYDDVHIVFDDALQTGSASAMANTNSLGSIRIGIIDATGFKNHSGELAHISFDAKEDSFQPFRLSGSVVVTDLHGKKVDSKIVIEQGDEELDEKLEEDEVVDAVMPADSNMPADKTPSMKYPRPYHSNSRLEETGQGKNKKNLPADKNIDSIEGYKPRSYDKNRQKNKHTLNKSILPQIKGKSSKVSKNKPVEYEIQKDKEKSGIYVIIIDLPRERLNFVLANGEIINLVQVDKKVNLKIMAENECILYIFTDTILRIELDNYNKINHS
ncbi:MAG: hypothetical protein U9R17_01350 [Thermodesulfobacteriota bacterium]|nr:hypothetical protein [Thermodesulfobacteriota bacterium]